MILGKYGGCGHFVKVCGERERSHKWVIHSEA